MKREELLIDLTPEQIAKIRGCKNQEELLALAKAEGVELTQEQLESVSGGMCTLHAKCPNCKSKDTKELGYWAGSYHWECNKCGYKFFDNP